jgi:hypothetical protein
MAFASSKTAKVYNVLLSRFERVVSSDDIKKTATAFQMDPRAALVALTRNRALEPVVFRGVYYVRNRNERDLRTIEEDPLRIVARACNMRLGIGWYFGLATALKLAGVWGQQSLTTITIITKRRQNPKTAFAGYTVEFKVLSIPSFEAMLQDDGIIRYSQPVRTLLDFAYFGARRGKSDEYARSVIAAISAKERKRLAEQARQSLSEYPQLYRVLLDRLLLELKKSEVPPHSG